jgi:hypothetical protein
MFDLDGWAQIRSRASWLLGVLGLLVVLGAGFAQTAAAESELAAPLYWSGLIPSGSSTGFYGISCASGSLCVAVDFTGDVISSTNPSAESSEWTSAHVEGAELPLDDDQGRSVSCAVGPVCVAVVGSVGKIITSTDPAGGEGAWTGASLGVALEAVSCASATLCVAVGEHGQIFTTTDPTAGAGAWTAADVDGETELKDVSCSSTALCVAVDEVGNILTSTDPTAGASSWTITHLSKQPLISVSCVATEFCLAAGNFSCFERPRGRAGQLDPY